MEHPPKQFRKRNAILAGLRESKAHPSAEDLFTILKPQIPDLSLGTVYRNLSLFKNQGLIVSLGTVKGVERFDGNTYPHVHFICSECGAVLDLEEVSVSPALSAAAAAACGGTVESCQLSFTGLCQKCNQRKEETA